MQPIKKSSARAADALDAADGVLDGRYFGRKVLGGTGNTYPRITATPQPAHHPAPHPAAMDGRIEGRNPDALATASAMKNLSVFGHVFSTHLNTVAKEKDYKHRLEKDVRETHRDNRWIANELNKGLVRKELLEPMLVGVPTDATRREAFEIECNAQREHDAELLEGLIQQHHDEEDERRRLLEERRRALDHHRKRLAETRRLVDDERARIAEARLRMKVFEENQPRYMMRLPMTGDLVVVNVINGEGFADMGSDPYIVVRFDEDKANKQATKKAEHRTNPFWNEMLKGVPYPEGAEAFVVEAHRDEPPPPREAKPETRDLKKKGSNLKPETRELKKKASDLKPKVTLIGTGYVHICHAENTVHMVELVDVNSEIRGRVFLRFWCYPAKPRYWLLPTDGQHGSSQTKLDLTIIQGRDLVDLDVVGKGEPYVVACWGTNATPFFKTKPLKGKNPMWNEGPQAVPIPPNTEFISLYVWDKDRLTKDDFMGMHRLQLLPDASDGEFWVPLRARENEPADVKLMRKANGDLGELNIRIKFHHPPLLKHNSMHSPLVRTASGRDDGLTFSPGNGAVPTRCMLTIVSVEGLKGLPNMQDPFVTVAVGKQQPGNAHKISAMWNPTFELFVPIDESIMRFKVYSNEDLRNLLGEADLDVRAAVRSNKPYVLKLSQGGTVDLSRTGGTGTIHVRTEWVGLESTPEPLGMHTRHSSRSDDVDGWP